MYLPRNVYTKMGETGHLVFGTEATQSIGLVKCGIVFAINPVKDINKPQSMGIYPLDWIVSTSPSYLMGGQDDRGIEFRKLFNIQRNSHVIKAQQDAMIRGEPFNPDVFLKAEARTIVPERLAKTLPVAFTALPDAAFDEDDLGMIKTTSVGVAIASAKWMGLKYIVIAGLNNVLTDPRVADLFGKWFEKVQPSWLYTFGRSNLPVRVYRHPDMPEYGVKLPKKVLVE